jgi:hypothetical protein
MTDSVLAFDAMLRHLTAADSGAMRSGAPVHLADHIDAASCEVDRRVKDMAADPDATVGGQYPNVPPWLRLSLVSTWSGFIAGTVNTCQHAPMIDHPHRHSSRVAPKPDRLRAQRPPHLTKPVGDADRTCDQCGHICGGLPDDGIHPYSLSFGLLLHFFGLCANCMAEHHDATSTHA